MSKITDNIIVSSEVKAAHALADRADKERAISTIYKTAVSALGLDTEAIEAEIAAKILKYRLINEQNAIVRQAKEATLAEAARVKQEELVAFVVMKQKRMIAAQEAANNG